jgi:hypothetical protein
MTPDEARTYGRELIWLAGVAERLSLRGVATATFSTRRSEYPELIVSTTCHTTIGVLDRNGVEEGRQYGPAALRIMTELHEEYAREFGPKGEGA